MKHAVMLLLFSCLACTPAVKKMDKVKAKMEIESVLDAWHKAAADAKFENYFKLMADSSIFMGTDETEYWTKKQFMEYSKPYFDKGKAWSFKARVRNTYIDDELPIAWFDEELDTPNLGPSRGSGVLKKVNNEWKILHYNLSIPIPNDIVNEVIKDVAEYHSKAKN